jgi:Ca2+-binding EF-hand superfamily protein
MEDKFATPEEGFSMIDRDGGGTVDRKELSAGLFKLGVWLHPAELRALFEHLDADGGGEVDLDEFIDFWKKF